MLGQQFSNGGNVAAGDLTEVISNIQDPVLKDVISSTAADMSTIAAQNGYGGLFMTAAVIAVLILLTVFILAPIRKKRLAS